jgi:hypothetical protein
MQDEIKRKSAQVAEDTKFDAPILSAMGELPPTPVPKGLVVVLVGSYPALLPDGVSQMKQHSWTVAVLLT